MDNTLYLVRFESDIDVYRPKMSEQKNLFSEQDYIDWVCYNAANTICFGDCSGEEVLEIYANGRKLKYVGWQPDMLFEFIDAETGLVVWKGSFPSWEH